MNKECFEIDLLIIFISYRLMNTVCVLVGFSKKKKFHSNFERKDVKCE